jgi:hypothetical protein
MRIFIHGNDRGSATLAALSLVFILSYILLSMVPRVINMKQAARLYREKVLSEIYETNRQLVTDYDLY